MTKRSKKSPNGVPDYTKVCQNKPPLYNIMILYSPKVDLSEFEDVSAKCFNCDSAQSKLLYSELKKKQHINYGVYTKDVAETIASKMKSLKTQQHCCAIKVS